ncbi:Glycoside hydrolase, family 79 [Corchorus olitorius]|uniref:Glycoside hydrolase, family 79 n=1 Tax=Corchorus olitorius TaxID=93759 RepID=A0A1R3KAQ8_9ROSI|nr:Glycoside hydrolase, family 79 [Corchorus olitorius]
MKRWDELNAFFNQTGAKITFSLNALIGRKESKTEKSLWVGNWYPHNAKDLMKYTISKGYKIDSYELGNELCGSGVSARIEAKQYGKDMIVLKKLIEKLYPNESTQPKVIGPGGFYEEEWFNTFLETTGPDVLDGVTHHIYNLGPGNDPNLINTIQDPYHLNQIAQTFKDVSNAVDKFAPWAGAWVGESGGAYNSGGKDVSRTFADGFWYLDQLGMTSVYNHKPGVSVVLINLSNNTSFEVSLSNDETLHGVRPNFEFKGEEAREEYHLTPKDGNIQSDVVLLNGAPLNLTDSLEIPKMNPKLVDASSHILVEAHSIVYVTIRDFNAPACA